MTTHAELSEFIRLVAHMRAAQRAYFKERSQKWLVKSCELEKRVDKKLDELHGGQQMLLELGE